MRKMTNVFDVRLNVECIYHRHFLTRTKDVHLSLLYQNNLCATRWNETGRGY